MSDKYIAKVIKVIDSYKVVINKGTNANITVGDKFTIIGLGETIVDPDTNEELEQLEIIKGETKATHVQEKIATLKSCLYGQNPDKKEITKVSRKISLYNYNLDPDTVTESVTPGEYFLLALEEVQVGDFVARKK